MRREILFTEFGYRRYRERLEDRPPENLFARGSVTIRDEVIRVLITDALAQRRQGYEPFLQYFEVFEGEEVDLVKVLSHPLEFHWLSFESVLSAHDWRMLDRMTRFMGQDRQRTLANLRVGVVGAGKTGSEVIEQLFRLPVLEVVIVDFDQLKVENIPDITNAFPEDALIDQPKVEFLIERSSPIFSNTAVRAMVADATTENGLAELRHVDVLISAIDQAFPRIALNSLAIQHLIPMIDSGLAIDADENGNVTSFAGQIQTVMPGMHCLECLNGLIKDRAYEEQMPDVERDLAVASGMTPESREQNASIGAFSKRMANTIILELLNLITGFHPLHRRINVDLLGQLDGSTREMPDHNVERMNTDHCVVCHPQVGLLGQGDVEPLPDYGRSHQRLPACGPLGQRRR